MIQIRPVMTVIWSLNYVSTRFWWILSRSSVCTRQTYSHIARVTGDCSTKRRCTNLMHHASKCCLLDYNCAVFQLVLGAPMYLRLQRQYMEKITSTVTSSMSSLRSIVPYMSVKNLFLNCNYCGMKGQTVLVVPLESWVCLVVEQNQMFPITMSGIISKCRSVKTDGI